MEPITGYPNTCPRDAFESNHALYLKVLVVSMTSIQELQWPPPPMSNSDFMQYLYYCKKYKKKGAIYPLCNWEKCVREYCYKTLSDRSIDNDKLDVSSNLTLLKSFIWCLNLKTMLCRIVLADFD